MPGHFWFTGAQNRTPAPGRDNADSQAVNLQGLQYVVNSASNMILKGQEGLGKNHAPQGRKRTNLVAEAGSMEDSQTGQDIMVTEQVQTFVFMDTGNTWDGPT